MKLNDAESLALDLMGKHGLHDWQFKFDNALRRFGLCKTRIRVISLSKRLVELNEEPRVRDCILHEIAHALAPKDETHGSEWKRIAKSIGCDGKRCYDPDVVTPPSRWVGTCPACGNTLKSIRRRRVSCGKCNPTFDRRFLLVWTSESEQPAPPLPIAKWLRWCPGCERGTYVHTKRATTACRNCCNKYNGGKYDAKYLFEWRRVTKSQQKELV
jgi:predicted SprT family Zn-dependent metalloprotease